MDLQAYRDEVRLALTGDLLDLEISDATLDKIINSALREVQRYICDTRIITTTFSRCINLSTLKDITGKPLKISTITGIFRAESISGNYVETSDPMYAMQWQLVGGMGNMLTMQNSIANYASWSLAQQIRNTISTDLAYYFDKAENKLYINASQGIPSKITIEYVPRFDTVEEIVTDYWIDVLIRLSVALAKIAVGRIRTRFTATGALWTQDGEKILEEGKTELTALREQLLANNQLIFPRD